MTTIATPAVPIPNGKTRPLAALRPRRVKVYPFPGNRHLVTAALRAGRHKTPMYGFLDVRASAPNLPTQAAGEERRMTGHKSTRSALNENAKLGAILIALAVLLLALSAIALVYVLGIRSKSAAVRNAARRFHHAVGNRLQMRSAGTPGRYASVIRHQGRATGRAYETPVWAVPTEDGFVIAIVYGSGTDWLKNVLASGGAAIVHDGDTYPVGQPEVVPMDSARAYFPATIARTQRLVGVDRCLRVRRVEAAKTPAAQGS